MEIMNLPVDGFICSFGVTIFAEGDFIHRELLDRELMRHFAEYAFANQIPLDFVGEDIRLSVHHEIPHGISLKSPEELFTRYGLAKISKIVVQGQWPEAFYDHFREYCSVVVSKPYFEAVHKGYTKSSGIQFIENYYGIPHENTVAIGDTLPDLEMIRYAGIGIAMGSGSPALLEQVRYVTDTLANDGVAVAMDCVLRGDLSALEKKEQE